MRFFSRAISGLFLFALTIALIAASGWTMYSAYQAQAESDDRRGGPQERVYSAQMLPYVTEDIAPELTVFGEVQSRRTLELRSAASGRVVTLSEAFVEGGRVEAGEVLLQIDPADAEFTRDTALTNMRQAEIELADADRGLALAEADLAAAIAQAELRQSALQRQRDLQARGSGTATSVETAELAAAAADQSVVSRRLALSQAQGRLDLAAAALERQQISLRDAERHLADTELRADFSGIVSNVSITAGRLVNQNEQLGELIDPSALEVAFRVSTADYARLLGPDGNLPELPVRIGLDVLGLNISAEGTLTREAGSVADGQSGRLLFASFDSGGTFRPGDFVSLTLVEPALANVARLPATALASDQTVLALGMDDRLEAVPVTLLRRQGDDVLVRAPALQGREVVRRLNPVLGDGVRIVPIRPDEDASSAQAPEAPEMLQLDPERRARLVEFVENNRRMPPDVRERMLQALAQDEVPARMVRNLEQRVGG